MGDRVPCGQANQSAAGCRGIALPDQLFTLIMEHRKQQDSDRDHAGTERQEGGWLFPLAERQADRPAPRSMRVEGAADQSGGAARHGCMTPGTLLPLGCFSSGFWSEL
jgi:hypothetical protein